MKNRLADPSCPILTTKGRAVGISFLRVLAGIMMTTHGIEKIANFQELATTFPDPLMIGAKTSLILIIIAEFGCSIFVTLGLFTRVFTIPLIFGMVVAAFFTHPEFSFGNSELAILYLGVFITLFFIGSGRYSLDNLLKKKFQGLYIL